MVGVVRGRGPMVSPMNPRVPPPLHGSWPSRARRMPAADDMAAAPEEARACSQPNKTRVQRAPGRHKGTGMKQTQRHARMQLRGALCTGLGLYEHVNVTKCMYGAIPKNTAVAVKRGGGGAAAAIVSQPPLPSLGTASCAHWCAPVQAASRMQSAAHRPSRRGHGLRLGASAEPATTSRTRTVSAPCRQVDMST
jgi:hypothetical protein